MTLTSDKEKGSVINIGPVSPFLPHEGGALSEQDKDQLVHLARLDDGYVTGASELLAQSRRRRHRVYF